MFSVDNDQNPNDAYLLHWSGSGTLCGPALGKHIDPVVRSDPEGFKQSPLVYTQCPDPDRLRHVTMHASRLDLGPVLAL